MEMSKVSISQLPSEIHDGDWHDSPLRWKVEGPNLEVQLFSSKKNASRYAAIRRKADSFSEASRKYALT